jgi:hypothetical protein
MNGPGAILGFGFANLPMLWWLGAAAAPLIIHLLNRRKYREVSWAAIEYLLAAVRKNSRRVQIEQWILLAIRTLIIALLVLAVAEFFLQMTGRKFVAGQRTHRVLVLDGSFSMGYKPTDQTRFDRAKELAVKIVNESMQGDGVTLVMMADPPRKVIATPAFERDSLRQEIEALVLPHGGANLAQTLALVEEVLVAARRDQPRLEQEEVYFLSDLGRVGWMPEQSELADVRQRASRLAQTTHLAVIDVGQPASDNLAITAIRSLDTFASLARDVTIEAEVENLGRQTRSRQLVEFFVDGRRAGEGYVDLEPGQRATTAFSYRFDTPGEHAIEAVTSGDLLEIDNHRWLALSVKESLRVLCIDGRLAGRNFGGATAYLKVALAPQGESARPGLVRVEVAPESALVETDLHAYDCLFLANVAQFTGSEALVLENYVKNGGGLVVFLGDQVQAENYNRQLGGDGPGQVRLLPARLGDVVEESQYLFDPLEYAHPIVSPFRGQEKAGLLTTQVAKYFQLSLRADSAARVALAFAGGGRGGDPVIVEETIGQGRSILVATSADTSWTSMPMWPSYVPIVQELLAAAVSGQAGEHNLLVGQSLGSSVRAAVGDIEVEVQPPAGGKDLVRVAISPDHSRWEYTQTMQSGAYRARLGPPVSRDELFAVNVNTAESDLTRLEVDDLRSNVWPDVDFSYSTVWQDLSAKPDDQISRRANLNRWFLYPVLAMLLLEPLLAWWFGRQGRT